MPEVVLRIDGLTKRYGTLTAVKNLTLAVHEGEVFGFLGPNGAGKTTSIHMMCGLLEPDAGHVELRGQRMSARDPEVRSRVGVCPQNIVLWPRLTCIEQLQFIGEMYDVPGAEARRRGLRLLGELGLDDKRDKQANTLSGGMQRRLNVAMALVHEPEIVVLDEPEAGLDPQSRVKVREYIQSLARKKTVILTTHNMDEAERVADRVAIVDHGELLVLDTPEALRRSIGEGELIEISVTGGAEGGIEKLRSALGERVRRVAIDPQGTTVAVNALDAVGVLPAILEAIGPAGFKAGEVRVRSNTLEDVFIELTGRRLRE